MGGYKVHCSISPDGSIVASGGVAPCPHFARQPSSHRARPLGSADGYAHFFNFSNASHRKALKVHSGVCTDVGYHPVVPDLVATAGWDGVVALLC